MNSKTLFISDLHLEEAHPEITAAFERFLDEQARHADALYILGDFFESWIGDDDNTPFIQHIKSQLKTLTDLGVKVYFMRGNRDFLLGKRFCKDTGMALLQDPTVIELNSEKILLTHGDYLCTDDIAHQKFLKFVDNKLHQFIFKLLPLCFRKKIVRRIREKSMARHIDKNITDVNQNTVEEWMGQHKVLTMIHGHTHRPATHEFAINGKPAKRIVLSDWDKDYYFTKI